MEPSPCLSSAESDSLQDLSTSGDATGSNGEAEKIDYMKSVDLQSQSDSAEFDEERYGILNKRWLRMNTREKNVYSEVIMNWMGEHYVESHEMSLLCQLVYQHYTHYCVQCSIATQNESVFDKILLKKYPLVSLKRIGRGETGLFYHSLDIKKTSDEYETVAKGRRNILSSNVQSPAKRAKKRQAEESGLDNDGGGVNGEPDAAEKKPPADPLRLAENPPSGKAHPSWLALSAGEKEAHKAATVEWLEKEYEISPSVCVPRSAIYEHYLEFCESGGIPPAPQHRLGEYVFKAFKKLKMRRLGTRGNSKYCYMGLDIREESTQYNKITAQRIICRLGKPKVNRIYTNS